jgi:hypothetical protein
VLPYLNASRYCQSDLLSRFANRQFGNEPAGHPRVTAICNAGMNARRAHAPIGGNVVMLPKRLTGTDAIVEEVLLLAPLMKDLVAMGGAA